MRILKQFEIRWQAENLENLGRTRRFTLLKNSLISLDILIKGGMDSKVWQVIKIFVFQASGYIFLFFLSSFSFPPSPAPPPLPLYF